MTRDARRDPSQPDEDELLPAGMKRRPTLPFGIPAVRPGQKLSESSARGRPVPLRPTTRPPSGYAEESPLRRDTPAAKRLGGFAPEPEDERFLEQLAVDLRPQLAWLLGDRRNEFHRELSEGHLDVALEMLLEDRRSNPRNVSATKAAHAMRDAIRNHVRDRVGPMDSVPFLVREPPIAARSYVRVLPLINGVSTIEDIIGSCQLPVLETIRALSRLHKVGCIDIPGIDLPALIPRQQRAPQAPSMPSPRAPVPRARRDEAPASSRLTMPEILAPFAADLEAMGVGDGDGDAIHPASSGVHPVVATAAATHAAPHAALHAALHAPLHAPLRRDPHEAGRARGPIADPTTPVPDGDEPRDAPISERSGERPHAHPIADETTAPVARIADEITAPAEPIADEETSDAPESYVEDAARASVPADPALDELGAVWRQRASRKNEARSPDQVGGASSPATSSRAPSALAEEPPPKEQARSLPSIPALDPPLAASYDASNDGGAPVSRRSQPPPANVRFIAIVAALAGLVIVAMIALRFVRSSPPSTSSAAPTNAARTEPVPTTPAAPLATPAAVDTAPSFIDRGTVTYTIKVTPKYARVLLDDVLLVPVTEVKLRREDKEHVLRAEAPGFATRELSVSAKSDASLVIALDKAPDARPLPAPGRPAPKPTNVAPTAVPEAPAPAPAQPYPE